MNILPESWEERSFHQVVHVCMHINALLIVEYEDGDEKQGFLYLPLIALMLDKKSDFLKEDLRALGMEQTPSRGWFTTTLTRNTSRRTVNRELIDAMKSLSQNHGTRTEASLQLLTRA